MYVCAHNELSHTHTHTYRWLIFAAGFLTALATFSRRFLPPNAVRDQHLGAIAAAQKVHFCSSTFSVDHDYQPGRYVRVGVCAYVRACLRACASVGMHVRVRACVVIMRL